jgi:signal transduction histidine kinase
VTGPAHAPEQPFDGQRSPHRRPRLALGGRALLLLAIINLLAFAAAGALLVRELERQQAAQALELYADFLRSLRSQIRPERELNVASILSWAGWSEVEDALLVDARLAPGSGDVPIAQGIAINPVGRTRRPLRAADAVLLPALAKSIETGDEFEVAGGRVVPIPIQGQNWGACWFRLPPRARMGALVQSLAPGFLVSTLLLIGATFLGLRRLVLEPVAALHRAAERIEGGDLAARVELKNRAGELSELGSTFNRMAARVEGFSRELENQVQRATEQARVAERVALTQRRLAALGELAAGIAHEINNPLGGLTNAVRALQTKPLDAERRARYLELLRDGLERIQAIVQRVLHTAPRIAEPQPVALIEVARDALLLVAHRAQDLGVTLELEVAGEICDSERLPAAELLRGSQILGARSELAQAVLNLLANALDALEAGPGARAIAPPRVRVVLTWAEFEVRLEVRDNGPGAQPEDLARARDLFFSTKEVGRGTGLGLSIVHAIAESHGGQLLLESEVGVGFAAILRLPRVPPPVS